MKPFTPAPRFATRAMLCAALCAPLAAPAAQAGSYTEPQIEAPVIVAETTSSSAPETIPLLLALITLAVAVSR